MPPTEQDLDLLLQRPCRPEPTAQLAVAAKPSASSLWRRWKDRQRSTRLHYQTRQICAQGACGIVSCETCSTLDHSHKAVRHELRISLNPMYTNMPYMECLGYIFSPLDDGCVCICVRYCVRFCGHNHTSQSLFCSWLNHVFHTFLLFLLTFGQNIAWQSLFNVTLC